MEKERVIRLWNYLNNVQDDFWPIYKWPMWAQKAMLREHKDHKSRYELFAFLNGNGVVPTRAVQMIYFADYNVQTGPIPGRYDAAALREFNDMIRKADAGDRTFYNKMSYWDMHNKRRMD